MERVSKAQFNYPTESFYEEPKVDRKIRRYMSPEDKSMRSDYFEIGK